MSIASFEQDLQEFEPTLIAALEKCGTPDRLRRLTHMWDMFTHEFRRAPTSPPHSRNDMCFCGSQRKYKKCCAEKEAATPRAWYEVASEKFKRNVARLLSTNSATA